MFEIRSNACRSEKVVRLFCQEDVPKTVAGTIARVTRKLKERNITLAVRYAKSIQESIKVVTTEEADLMWFDVRMPKYPGGAEVEEGGLDVLEALHKGTYGTTNWRKPFLIVSQQRPISEDRITKKEGYIGFFDKANGREIVRSIVDAIGKECADIGSVEIEILAEDILYAKLDCSKNMSAEYVADNAKVRNSMNEFRAHSNIIKFEFLLLRTMSAKDLANTLLVGAEEPIRVELTISEDEEVLPDYGVISVYRSGLVRSFGKVREVSGRTLILEIENLIDFVDPEGDIEVSDGLVKEFKSDGILYAVRIDNE